MRGEDAVVESNLFLLHRRYQTSQEKMARFGGEGGTFEIRCHLLPTSSLVSTPPPTPASFPLPVEAWMRLKAAM